MTPIAPPNATVLKTKVCLLGEQAVGKTSLVHRLVSGAFDEVYIRTLGAVVTKKGMDVETADGQAVHVDLTILDIMGKRTFLDLFQDAYFHGAGGILAVADLTRRSTLDVLTLWIGSVQSLSGTLPVVLVVNKADLGDRAEYGAVEIEDIAGEFGAQHLLTSARTGDNVEEAFRRLACLAAERQLRQPRPRATTL